MAEKSINTVSESSVAEIATNHADDEILAKDVKNVVEETGNEAIVSALTQPGGLLKVEHEESAPLVVPGEDSGPHDLLSPLAQEEATNESKEVGGLPQEKKRDCVERELVGNEKVAAPAPEEVAEVMAMQAEKIMMPEEVANATILEGKDGKEAEASKQEEMIAPVEVKEAENRGVIEVVSGPELLLEDGNANIEMPAIVRTLVQRSACTGEIETNSIVQESVQVSSNANNEEAESIANSALNMRALKRNPLESTRQKDKLEDPFGVQSLQKIALFQLEDSQHLRANHPTTTTYRVAAIKKKPYTTLGNTLFLIFSGLVLIVLVSAFSLYLASAASVNGSKVGVAASTLIQNTPAVEIMGGLPARFAGAETTAPFANGTVLAGYQWIHDGTKHALYVDVNNHIQELYTGDQQTWHITDLTKGAGAAVSNGRAVAGFDWQRGNSEQVVYIDAKGHVQEIFASTDDQWDVMDLTRKAQAPLANGRALSGYEWLAAGSKQVVYVDQSNHIQELTSSDGNNWRVSDLTVLTKAPLANGNVVVGYGWTSLGSMQIDYIDINQHVQELSFSGGSWNHVDLHSLVGAPLARGNVLVGYEWRQTGAKQIAYLDTNNHIQLLSSVKVGNWNLTDLTLTRQCASDQWEYACGL